MIIPKDNGRDYRLRKFVEYQHGVPPVHRAICSAWARKREPNELEIVKFSWLVANSYHELTSFLLFDLTRNEHNKNSVLKKFWFENRENIQLGSAKIKAKIRDRFLLPLEWLDDDKINNILNIFKRESDSFARYEFCENYILNAPQFGRFSCDLFLEMIQSFFESGLFAHEVSMKRSFDWKNCANLTSAVLNIMYEDELANAFDAKKIKTGELEKLQPRLEATVDDIKNAIDKKYGGDKDRSQFVTKLCSFRNLFKGKRYAGYHHDRQLGYLIRYSERLPEFENLWKECFELRKECYPDRFLGELNGWKGIRNKMNNLWILKGLTGVERFSNEIPEEFENYELF